MATGPETGLSLNPESVSKRIVQTLVSSQSVQLVLLGIVFVLAGYLKQIGPLAAMFAVWGAAFVIAGVVSYAVIWKTRY